LDYWLFIINCLIEYHINESLYEINLESDLLFLFDLRDMLI